MYHAQNGWRPLTRNSPVSSTFNPIIRVGARIEDGCKDGDVKTEFDLDHARALAAKAFEAMEAFNVPPSPRNFEIWFAHASGTNPELTSAINGVFADGQGWTEKAAASLHARFVAAPSEQEALIALGTQLKGEINSVLTSVEQAGQQTRSYGQALDAVSGMMEGGLDASGLKALIHQATAATRAMHARATMLEARLTQASREVETLRANLEEIRQEALTDDLTRLANRKHFDERLEHAAEEADRSAQSLCLVMGDVDRFKTFNDTWGHQTGDQVLRLVAQCFKENIKGRDTAARYGGEEFALILPATSLENARIVADQIRRTVEAKSIVKRSTGESLGSITMSLGVASYRQGENIMDTLRRADSCLYAAKRGGRNQVVTEDDSKRPANAA